MKVRMELNFGFGFVWLGKIVQSYLDKKRKRRIGTLLKADVLTKDQQQELDSLVSLVGGDKIMIGG